MSKVDDIYYDEIIMRLAMQIIDKTVSDKIENINDYNENRMEIIEQIIGENLQ